MERAPSSWRRLHGRIVGWTPQPWTSGVLFLIAGLFLFEGATGIRLGGTRWTDTWSMGEAVVGAGVFAGAGVALLLLHRLRRR